MNVDARACDVVSDEQEAEAMLQALLQAFNEIHNENAGSLSYEQLYR